MGSQLSWSFPTTREALPLFYSITKPMPKIRPHFRTPHMSGPLSTMNQHQWQRVKGFNAALGPPMVSTVTLSHGRRPRRLNPDVRNQDSFVIEFKIGFVTNAHHAFPLVRTITGPTPELKTWSHLLTSTTRTRQELDIHSRAGSRKLFRVRYGR